ncbi:MAG: hypothetical protein V2I97_15970 [Desulfococcaceae bacterium]|nr:hypothetical protein [Desulfococcaceae bacterium]
MASMIYNYHIRYAEKHGIKLNTAPDPQTVEEASKKVFELRKQGRKWKKIAEIMTNSGYLSVKGKKLNRWNITVFYDKYNYREKKQSKSSGNLSASGMHPADNERVSGYISRDYV